MATIKSSTHWLDAGLLNYTASVPLLVKALQICTGTLQ